MKNFLFALCSLFLLNLQACDTSSEALWGGRYQEPIVDRPAENEPYTCSRVPTLAQGSLLQNNSSVNKPSNGCELPPHLLDTPQQIETNDKGELVLKGTAITWGPAKGKRLHIKELTYVEKQNSSKLIWVMFDCADAADGSQTCKPACTQAVEPNMSKPSRELCTPFRRPPGDKILAVNIERQGALVLDRVVFENKDCGLEVTYYDASNCISPTTERYVDGVLFPSMDWIKTPQSTDSSSAGVSANDLTHS